MKKPMYELPLGKFARVVESLSSDNAVGCIVVRADIPRSRDPARFVVVKGNDHGCVVGDWWGPLGATLHTVEEIEAEVVERT